MKKDQCNKDFQLNTKRFKIDCHKSKLSSAFKKY